MKYLVLIYHNAQARQMWERMTEGEQAAGLKLYAALHAELVASGELLASEPLADARLGKRISAQGEQTLVTDGPFAEVKEQLAGFFLVECDSEQRAIEIAARVPEARFGLVEVRPTMTYSAGGIEM